MGLDMYLSAEEYIGGWGHSGPEAQERYRAALGVLGVKPDMITPGSPHIDVSYSIAYWRKANAIHAWFVREVQDGKDECQKSYVTKEQLGLLRSLAQQALGLYDAGQLDAAAALLPPQSGFFFGSTAVDEDFRADLASTVAQLDKVLTDWADRSVDFYYRSSW